MENLISSLSNRDGEVLFFTAIPDQEAMRRHISENCEDYGWEDNETQTFDNWLEEQAAEQTQSSLRYYATVVPQGYTLQDVFRTQTFDKFLEKCYEEETGWLYELNTIQPETIGDNVEVIVLDFDEDYEDYEDLQLGVITKDMIA